MSFRLLDLFRKRPGRNDLGSYDELEDLTTGQLLALMRHEAHRIEKAIYNDILQEKHPVYLTKWERVGKIQVLLTVRGVPATEPTVAWAKEIHDHFEDLEASFIRPRSEPAPPSEPEAIEAFLDFLKARRSVRVWAPVQPRAEELEALALQLIDAARWAPTSGNRQPWRFKILIEPGRKELLRGLKEEHCISAPLLIFVGMDTRLYGALGDSERSIHIDGGAAAMQMVLAGHRGGYGVCWNHFADDLVLSRPSNVDAYEKFAAELGIPPAITPLAIIAVGRPAFVPPTPARTNLARLLIPDP